MANGTSSSLDGPEFRYVSHLTHMVVGSLGVRNRNVYVSLCPLGSILTSIQKGEWVVLPTRLDFWFSVKIFTSMYRLDHPTLRVDNAELNVIKMASVKSKTPEVCSLGPWFDFRDSRWLRRDSSKGYVSRVSQPFIVSVGIWLVQYT